MKESLDGLSGRKHNNDSQRIAIYDRLKLMGCGSQLQKNKDYKRGDESLGDEFEEGPIGKSIKGVFHPDPLETRSKGVVVFNEEHHLLRAVKKDYGKGARDAVMQCRTYSGEQSVIQRPQFAPDSGSMNDILIPRSR